MDERMQYVIAPEYGATSWYSPQNGTSTRAGAHCRRGWGAHRIYTGRGFGLCLEQGVPGIGNDVIRGGNHKGLSSATPIGRSMDGDRELAAEEPLDIRRVRWAGYPDAVGIVSDGTLVHVQVLERLFSCRIDEHTECWEVSYRNHGEFEWGTDVEG
jgi:hypothetical protein